MKFPYAAFVTLPLLFGCCLSSAPPAQAAPTTSQKEPGPAPLDAALNEVQKALQNAQDTLAKSDLPPLQTVQLTLHTYVGVDATAKVKILFISFGGSQGASASQELALTLSPPKPKPKAELMAALTPKPTAADSIVELIKAAAEAVKTAENGKPPLEAKALTLDLAFTVTRIAGGGLQFEVGPISGGATGEAKNSSEQRIKITFGR